MNTQMLLVIVTFLTAATLAMGVSVENPNSQNNANAAPQVSAATGRALELPRQPGPGAVGPPGDADDLDKAEFFYGGFGGLGFGGYYGGGWGGRYYGYGRYPYGGGGYYGGYRPYGYGWY